MKRDMELVRDLLLKIAEAARPIDFDDLMGTADDDYRALATYHMQMMIEEAGFIRGVDASSMSGRNWIELELTWRGQDFLESIRDPTVWENTKQGAVCADYAANGTPEDVREMPNLGRNANIIYQRC